MEKDLRLLTVGVHYQCLRPIDEDAHVLLRHARAVGGNGLLIEHDARVGILCLETFQEIGTGDVVGWRVARRLHGSERGREGDKVGGACNGGKVNLLGDVAIDVLLNRIQSALDGNRLELCTGNGRITGRRHFGACLSD